MKKLHLSILLAGLAIAGPAYADDVLIGLGGPMTGQYATFGTQFKNGIELAIADINAAGGVLGKTIKYELADDACDPKQARSVAEKISGDKVAVVIGHFCSGSSIPASEVYAENGILQITPASTNPQFTERGMWNTFRICGRDDQQGTLAGQYIASHFKGKNVAILHDKSTYGKGLADETKKGLEKAGLKEKMYESYTAGDKDFSALVSKMKAANIDVVYIGGYHTEAGLILRQMRDQGLKAQLISGDAIVTNEYWAITGPLGAGTMMTFGPDPRKKASAAAVVKRLKAKGIDPEGYTIYSYAALQAWVQAVTKAKTFDSKKVAEVLRAGTWDTVLGKLSFNKKGDLNFIDYVMYKWDKDGKYNEIGG